MSMRLNLVAFAFAFATLPLAAGEDVATSSAYEGFYLNTVKPIAVRTSSEVASLRALTYRAGETVTATAPDDTVTTLVESAATDGTVAFSPTAGGMWRLENSNGAVAFLGVSWDVFNDSWSLNSAALSPFKMHTQGAGPDRKGRSQYFPDVAYSGDDWHGAASAGATLRITSPKEVETVINRTGTGTTPFSFQEPGSWTVRLTMADDTVREAAINVSAGLIFVVF